MSLSIRSPAFEDGGAIPAAHTCEGADRSPTLVISGVPPGAKSLALIVDDPDAPDPRAPQRTWVHWVVYDLPPSTTSLPAGVDAASLPEGAAQGRNDWEKASWGGPCPPIGRHRYFFKLYALDTTLGLESPDKKALEVAMRGHVLAQCEIIGTYEKKGAR